MSVLSRLATPEIGIAVGHWTLSNKKCCIWHSCIKAGHFVLHSIIAHHMWKIFEVKTRLAYRIAYYKSIKSLYPLMQQAVKGEHTRRYLLLYTFKLISCDN